MFTLLLRIIGVASELRMFFFFMTWQKVKKKKDTRPEGHTHHLWDCQLDSISYFSISPQHNNTGYSWTDVCWAAVGHTKEDPVPSPSPVLTCLGGLVR